MSNPRPAERCQAFLRIPRIVSIRCCTSRGLSRPLILEDAANRRAHGDELGQRRRDPSNRQELRALHQDSPTSLAVESEGVGSGWLYIR